MFSIIALSCFGVFLALQLFFWLFFFTALAAHKEQYETEGHKPISVIICAHNELENLRRLIPVLIQQNYHDYEIIIINDRSFDETEDFLKEQILLHKKLKVVTVENVPVKMDPKKYALTLGIKAATHEHLLFSDADCIPD